MTKCQQQLELMVKNNQSLFDEFKNIHDLYTENPNLYQEKFNEIGRDVQDIIRRYENILCRQSEGSGFGKYSAKLADKFHQEIKKLFPKIDFIGISRE